jgi:hypothetical protein
MTAMVFNAVERGRTPPSGDILSKYKVSIVDTEFDDLRPESTGVLLNIFYKPARLC